MREHQGVIGIPSEREMMTQSPEVYSALEDTPFKLGDKRKNLVVVISAIVACFCCGGLVFGFSALYPHLLSEGIFHDRCLPDEQNPCAKQRLAVGNLFTDAASALNFASFPAGILLDRFGPAKTASLMSAIIAFGCYLFGVGYYSIGFVLLGMAGQPFFISTLSFAKLFPSNAGFITAALVGCFNASSMIFLFFSEALDVNYSLQHIFLAYAFIPGAFAAIAFFCWPESVVVQAPHVKSVIASQPRTTKEQILSKHWFALTFVVSIYNLSVNFMLGTISEQLNAVDQSSPVWLNHAFVATVSAGSVVSIPIIGKICDVLGLSKGWKVLWSSFVCVYICQVLFVDSGWSAYALTAFAVFACARPLMYTLAAAQARDAFTPDSFGALYGLLFAIAGLVNQLEQPLHELALQHGFLITYVGLAVLQTAAFALLLISGFKS